MQEARSEKRREDAGVSETKSLLASATGIPCVHVRVRLLPKSRRQRAYLRPEIPTLRGSPVIRSPPQACEPLDAGTTVGATNEAVEEAAAKAPAPAPVLEGGADGGRGGGAGKVSGGTVPRGSDEREGVPAGAGGRGPRGVEQYHSVLSAEMQHAKTTHTTRTPDLTPHWWLLLLPLHLRHRSRFRHCLRYWCSDK